jgi:hypothetical protein
MAKWRNGNNSEMGFMAKLEIHVTLWVTNTDPVRYCNMVRIEKRPNDQCHENLHCLFQCHWPLTNTRLSKTPPSGGTLHPRHMTAQFAIYILDVS